MTHTTPQKKKTKKICLHRGGRNTWSLRHFAAQTARPNCRLGIVTGSPITILQAKVDSGVAMEIREPRKF